MKRNGGSYWTKRRTVNDNTAAHMHNVVNWLNAIETPCQSNDEPLIPCQTEEPGVNLCEVQPNHTGQVGAYQDGSIDMIEVTGHGTTASASTDSGDHGDAHSILSDITNKTNMAEFEHEGDSQFSVTLDTPEPHLSETYYQDHFVEPLHDEGDDIDSDVSNVLSWYSFPTSDDGSSDEASISNSCKNETEEFKNKLKRKLDK